MENEYDIAIELYDQKKYKEAYDIFYTLAKNDDYESQKNVANMLIYGLGVKKDEHIGYMWYKKIADTGDEICQHSIAGCYIHGLYGFEINFEKAVTYLQKASDQGYSPAIHDLAIMLINGNGIKKDKDEARKLLEENVQKGYNKSGKLLATYCLTGKFGIFNIFTCLKYLYKL